MKIIELCGNPGCGKTTLCGLLADRLREQGLRVFQYNEVKETKMVRNLKYFRSGECRRTAGVLFRYGSRIHLNKRTFLYSVKCAVILEQLRRWKQRQKADYILFDEGILQYMTTLSHGVRMDAGADKALALLSAYYSDPDYYVMNCRVSDAENVRRLRARNRQGDRFLMEDETSQLQALSLKQENIDKVIDGVSPLHLCQVDTGDKEKALEVMLGEIGLKA